MKNEVLLKRNAYQLLDRVTINAEVMVGKPTIRGLRITVEQILNDFIAVESPDFIIKGYGGALIAIKRIETKFLAVVYKETNNNDAFVVTAYFTSKIKLEREVVLWQRQK